MSSIPYLVGWCSPAEFIQEEVKQLVEEGRDSVWIEKLMQQKREPGTEAQLWADLQAAPTRSDYPFVEPSDLAGIRAARGPGLRQKPVEYSDDTLRDRMLAAWLGRCCGCALGKPVELFMAAANGLSSKERIKTYLEAISPGEYPLNNYFSKTSPASAQTGAVNCHPSTREDIAFMESDDDIRYTVLAQKVLLAKGRDFTTEDVMQAWFSMLTYAQVCTAETQAYRNHSMRYQIHCGKKEEVDWSWVAMHQNPFREWIGAQIRADAWGYAAPGNPELAAEFAWRDARLSHIKNGIYGEMFVAAMIAAAFVLDDPLAVVEAGLAEIPRKSRLHDDISRTIDVCRQYDFQASAFEAVLDELYARLGNYHAVHTNNNAAVVVAALLLGGRDFEKVITIAVMAGLDTDCNGATAGSIFGAMFGSAAIPTKWTAPLNDTLYAEVTGYHPIAISECARRSFEIAKTVGSAKAP